MLGFLRHPNLQIFNLSDRKPSDFVRRCALSQNDTPYRPQRYAVNPPKNHRAAPGELAFKIHVGSRKKSEHIALRLLTPYLITTL
jgi:hypothetical protein